MDNEEYSFKDLPDNIKVKHLQKALRKVVADNKTLVAENETLKKDIDYQEKTPLYKEMIKDLEIKLSTKKHLSQQVFDLTKELEEIKELNIKDDCAHVKRKYEDLIAKHEVTKYQNQLGIKKLKDKYELLMNQREYYRNILISIIGEDKINDYDEVSNAMTI